MAAEGDVVDCVDPRWAFVWPCSGVPERVVGFGQGQVADESAAVELCGAVDHCDGAAHVATCAGGSHNTASEEALLQPRGQKILPREEKERTLTLCTVADEGHVGEDPLLLSRSSTAPPPEEARVRPRRGRDD